MIEVQEEQRERSSLLLGGVELALESFLECARVGQPGLGVHECEARELRHLGEFHQPGDGAEHGVHGLFPMQRSFHPSDERVTSSEKLSYGRVTAGNENVTPEELEDERRIAE